MLFQEISDIFGADCSAAFYIRPHDFRARLTITIEYSEPWSDVPNIIITGSYMRCTLLSTVKITRHKSSLKLLRLRRPELNKPPNAAVHDDWAVLNFPTYESMVLFYCTFVAMKRQSQFRDANALPVGLQERAELCSKRERRQGLEHGRPRSRSNINEVPPLLPDGEGEDILSTGVIILPNNRPCTLRLCKDICSGVVRLDAAVEAPDGIETPLWTAFVTKYYVQGDVDWAELLEARHGLRKTVGLAAIRPKIYLFARGDGLLPESPKEGGYLIKFKDEICKLRDVRMLGR
ncbi:hypothetical protein K470DRAFT_85390 [Piedraia hortae CBS 480.64]|uniref:Uncharacterized protein n=1 Tax=Piedraia hortae CBS 480.64 TaxID=1314780 RepID=A0A6A7C8K6_9PEZI|nr:hypothetical protein K470DRAFT_85390 [Piedraia hortae CBS 480.64]